MMTASRNINAGSGARNRVTEQCLYRHMLRYAGYTEALFGMLRGLLRDVTQACYAAKKGG